MLYGNLIFPPTSLKQYGLNMTKTQTTLWQRLHPAPTEHHCLLTASCYQDTVEAGDCQLYTQELNNTSEGSLPQTTGAQPTDLLRCLLLGHRSPFIIAPQVGVVAAEMAHRQAFPRLVRRPRREQAPRGHKPLRLTSTLSIPALPPAFGKMNAGTRGKLTGSWSSLRTLHVHSCELV